MMIADALTAMAVFLVSAGLLHFRMQPTAFGRPVAVLRLHAERWRLEELASSDDDEEDGHSDRRDGERRLISASASLDSVENENQSLEVDILDLGRTGMRIALDERLAPETAIQLLLNGSMLLGTVIYCRRLDDRFHAGIRLEKRIDRAFLERMIVHRAR